MIRTTLIGSGCRLLMGSLSILAQAQNPPNTVKPELQRIGIAP
jgi:hypothetical protein